MCWIIYIIILIVVYQTDYDATIDQARKKIVDMSFCEPYADNSCSVDVSAVTDVEISVINIGGDVSNADPFAIW